MRPSLSFALTFRFGLLRNCRPIEPVHALGVHQPALATEQHVNAPVAIAHASLRDLLDPLLETGLRRTAGLVVVARWVDAHVAAGAANDHLPDRPNVIDKLPLQRCAS